jgi:hypothetical protein
VEAYKPELQLVVEDQPPWEAAELDNQVPGEVLLGYRVLEGMVMSWADSPPEQVVEEVVVRSGGILLLHTQKEEVGRNCILRFEQEEVGRNCILRLEQEVVRGCNLHFEREEVVRNCILRFELEADLD